MSENNMNEYAIIGTLRPAAPLMLMGICAECRAAVPCLADRTWAMKCVECGSEDLQDVRDGITPLQDHEAWSIAEQNDWTVLLRGAMAGNAVERNYLVRLVAAEITKMEVFTGVTPMWLRRFAAYTIGLQS